MVDVVKKLGYLWLFFCSKIQEKNHSSIQQIFNSSSTNFAFIFKNFFIQNQHFQVHQILAIKFQEIFYSTFNKKCIQQKIHSTFNKKYVQQKNHSTKYIQHSTKIMFNKKLFNIFKKIWSTKSNTLFLSYLVLKLHKNYSSV